jgi:hypothetical protein
MHDATDSAADPSPKPKPVTGSGAGPVSDGDAWSMACAEDLAAERARRRGAAAPSVDAAEELRRLFGALTEQAGRLGTLAGGAAAGLVAETLAARARAAVEPVLDRHSDVLDHLVRAGDELAAAARSVLTPQQAPPPAPETTVERDARDLGDDRGQRDEQG